MAAQFDSDSLATIHNMVDHKYCFGKYFESTKVAFDGINVAALGDGGPSRQVRDLVEDNMLLNGWEARILIDRQLPDEISLANYTIDYQLIFESQGCDYKHQLVAEMCFDNRQAIGTNLLKADFANRNFTAVPDRASAAILVVLNSGAREAGRWDNGVGVQDEYSLALRRVYTHNISTTILLLVVV
ncbi:MAG: hypothetical protein PXZ08_10675 [Actinomycetota bacterium]|nr:hypothetical protein [Actinomycetota bacterium]